MTTLHLPVGPRDHVQGPADAPVTLVEYGDYQCPYCAKAHPIVLALQARLGDQLRFVFRNFPLTRIHRDALPAAVAAESVAQLAGPEAFWAMHHLIFEHQRDSADALRAPKLLGYAAEAGADAEQVARYLDSAELTTRVREDFMSGVRSGVNGTPTFFINGERFDGDWTDAEGFTRALIRAAEAGVTA
ncbi:MAG TPA: thioredoxin domain-containing protein [Gemmatimonadales bacterium]|nr:thioredoxin domain-containing protein [Gemmatimonadales bacterium]